MSETISSGVTVSGQTFSGGDITVLFGGLALDDVMDGVGVVVSSGGVLISDTLTNPDLDVMSGGIAENLIVIAGSSLGNEVNIAAGGSINGLTLLDGSVDQDILFFDEGSAENVTADGLTYLGIDTGFLDNASFTNGAELGVRGGTIENITIGQGGDLVFSSLASATGLDVQNGGVVSEELGFDAASSSDNLVEQGGELLINTISNTTIASGGLVVVSSSQTGTTIENGGVLIEADGAGAENAPVFGGGSAFSTGVAVLSYDSSSGFSVVTASSALNDISTSDLVEILQGGTVTNSNIEGTVNVFSGGLLADGTITSGTVDAGGEVIGGTLVNSLIVSAGGYATDLTVLSGADI